MDKFPSELKNIQWKTFKETDLIEFFSKNLISTKENLDILILGSYRGSNSIPDLENFRDILKAKGIKGAHLAIDRMQHISQELSETEYNYINSFDQIEKCDFGIFVLYGDRENSGPAIELQHSLQSDFGHKLYVGIRSSEANEISSMIKGAIEHHKIVKYEFETLEDLASAFEGYLDSKELA